MLPWLRAPQALKIAVVGDLILDEYWEGRVERISPEAPVPINLVKHTSLAAGGAANSALNIRLVGGQVSIFGIWGEDAAATNLATILHQHEICTKGVLSCNDRPTPRKTRVTSGLQQMLRIDWEHTQPISSAQEAQLLTALQAQDFHGILISDYGKGLLQRELLAGIFAYARAAGIPTIVDPKGQDFSKYRGCSLITPNYGEACLALGVTIDAGWSGEALARRLQEHFGLCDILVTMGAQGMVYLPQGEQSRGIYRAPQAREVFDVSGAGDTVAALMTLALAAQVGPQEAVELANCAAGIVVEKRGTQPVQRHELEARLRAEAGGPKQLPLEILLQILRKAQAEGKRVVFTNGCFDLLHAGHIETLEKAKSFGNILVVALNSDESVRLLNKGAGRPLLTLANRQRVIAALACVDYVISFSEATPGALIEALQPDILVKGGDYQINSIVGADSVLARGGRVEVVDLVPELSTTALIKAILAAPQL